jgi:hypothetical protein
LFSQLSSCCSKVNCKDHLPDKPVTRGEQAPEAIRIAPYAGAATLAAHAPAQFAARTFIVRLMSQGFRNSEIAKFTLDIDIQSTTIWLWIAWTQHLRLCLIQPGGR